MRSIYHPVSNTEEVHLARRPKDIAGDLGGYAADPEDPTHSAVASEAHLAAPIGGFSLRAVKGRNCTASYALWWRHNTLPKGLENYPAQH